MMDARNLTDWAKDLRARTEVDDRLRVARRRRLEAEWERDEAKRVLREIADFDAFQGGPIAPIENLTTTAMRQLARDALDREQVGGNTHEVAHEH